MNTTLDLFPLPVTTVDLQNTRSAIRFYSSKCWNIPSPLVSNYFSEYYLIYWSGMYLSEKLANSGGYLVRIDPLTSRKKSYKVEYSRSLTRGKILANPDAQFALSFRSPSVDWNLDNVVLISAANR